MIGTRPHAIADLHWLVDRRSKIQMLSVAVIDKSNSVIEKFTKNQLTDDFQSRTARLLVGATFSLWRAVFLANTNTNVVASLEYAKAYLEKVVRDNSVTYTDDKTLMGWTFSYYVNNAYFRLHEILKICEALETNEVRAAETKVNLLPIMNALHPIRPTDKAVDFWDQCHEASTVALRLLD